MGTFFYFRDSGHLLQLAAVFLAGFLAFLTVRALLVPEHYLDGPDATTEPPRSMTSPHTMVNFLQVIRRVRLAIPMLLRLKSKGKHAHVIWRIVPRSACETC